MDRTQARIVDVPIDAIHDDHKNKGEFVEMEESYLKNMFKDLVLEEGYELGAEFDLGETHGADYYAERNPGFPDEWYYILAEEHKILNKEYKDTDTICLKDAESTDQKSIKADPGEPQVGSEEQIKAPADHKGVESVLEPVVRDQEGIP
jgi:hypothetical protein